jgi:hypothetical protein
LKAKLRIGVDRPAKRDHALELGLGGGMEIGVEEGHGSGLRLEPVMRKTVVVPAKAGTSGNERRPPEVPACAGTTLVVASRYIAASFSLLFLPL